MTASFGRIARHLVGGNWRDRGTYESLESLSGLEKPSLQAIEAARAEVEAILNAPLVPAEVTPRQIRLALIASEISLASIEAALAGNEAARVEWDFALEIKRDHALLNALAGSLGLTSAQVDDLFRLAATL